MRLAISTNWNSMRHESAEDIIGEIKDLGFDTVELGYALSREQADGIVRSARIGSVKICSLHAFCPIQRGGSPDPEPYSICELSENRRIEAVNMTLETGRYAADAGAAVVVLHAGRVPLHGRVKRVMRLAAGKRGRSRWFEWANNGMLAARERRVKPYLEALRKSLDTLIPEYERMGLKLGLENMPTYDGVPNEPEMRELLDGYRTPSLGYWHDMGHGQVRENIGWIHHAGIATRFKSDIVGMHIHDVVYPARDHLMPPCNGTVKFEKFREIAHKNIPLVLEPAYSCDAESVARAMEFLAEKWNLNDAV